MSSRESSQERTVAAPRAGTVTATLVSIMEPFKVEDTTWNSMRRDCNSISKQAIFPEIQIFITTIGQEAYSLLGNFLAPDKLFTKPYSALVETIKKHLKPKTGEVQISPKSMYDFLAELRKNLEPIWKRPYRNNLVSRGPDSHTQKRESGQTTLFC